MEKKDIKYLAIIALLIFGLMKCNSDFNYQKQKNQDNTKEYKDELGRNVTEINQLEMSNRMFKKLLDSLELQKKNAKSLTIVKTKTEVQFKEKTIISYDTIKENDTVYVSPIYSAYIGDKWARAYIYASKDTVKGSFTIENELYMSHYQEPSLFKIKPITLSVTQANPYTKQEVESYVLKPKKPLFDVGIQTGLGIDLITKKPTVYAGFGVGVNLIR